MSEETASTKELETAVKRAISAEKERDEAKAEVEELKEEHERMAEQLKNVEALAETCFNQLEGRDEIEEEEPALTK